ncbi:ACP S-malonyltransferase [Sulfuriflexus sp.]|uniref:ACP S-malonyltransferase n=1 Tax=Sulfuriflexus sp. TaxID=2015443 RepID=UPI0028CE4E6E|nr:ACP S-malonyltransferase [Sulfuriflexus sp.]MDT8404200.1 ACP S-malonyltransferase [Sulfuriflexus sp.]
MSFAFIFPGQGSQSVGMLADLAASFPVVEETFAEASAALGYDLWQLVQKGPVEELNSTDRTQPAMLTAGVACWRVWQQQGGGNPAVMAGHSLGEYTALVCADAMSLADAVTLVADRGRFMQAVVPEGEGAMAAILGLADEDVIAVCAEAAQGEVLSAVNFNSPGQVVIAGSAAAVARAAPLARERGAKRALILPVSVPSHCALMAPAAAKLAERLTTISFNSPSIPVINNADVDIPQSAEAICAALVKQLDHPVRWVDTINRMTADGIDTVIECGPGKVLVGLNKRINKEMQALPLFDAETLNAALAASK